jgi:hypothetical protein
VASVLDLAEMRFLTAWCARRGLRWCPLRGEANRAEMLLEPLDARRPWQRLRLVLEDDGFALEDEPGEVLATASDLPALLDALDGGVDEPAPEPRPHWRRPAAVGMSLVL